MAWSKEWAKPFEPSWPNGNHTREEARLDNMNVDGTIIKVYNNLPPTHDPYTNPDANIYYQCNCGAILDPGTKSFAALNNAAMNTGWKVRWGATSYVPYCVECGKDVE